ncbi:MAG TPA: response regulator [Candidatus Bathyarchaeia archaeon]|nr:response regulator [Candidatus Bathyarchaeia archaeon]
MHEESRRLVLVIEDDKPIGQIVTEAINDEAGYRAVHIDNPSRALALLEQLVPDLLVMDVQLPGMTGLELYESLRSAARTRGVPVLFETANGPAHAEEFRRLGVAWYVSKPFDIWELVAYVKQLAPPRPFSARATN